MLSDWAETQGDWAYKRVIKANIHHIGLRSIAITCKLPLGKRFQANILPILRRGGRPLGEEHFDKEILQRWILHRALEMGWSKERFGLFDGKVDSKGRDAYKPERIGKKYQWIAREEFFARMSDNFEFATDPHALSVDELKTGKWTHHFRDIDPSLLLRSTPKVTTIVNPQCWWARVSYQDWFCQPTKLAWLRSTSDLPNPSTLLEVVNPADGSRWFVLDGFTKWQREENLGNIGAEEPDLQELWYGFRSYFVLKRESQRILKWAAVQDWRRKEMPEVRSGRLRICLHEYYWPPHFDWPTSEDWFSELFPPQERLPGAILLGNDVYMCEQGTYDCSVDDTIWMRLPCRWLVEKMNLKMKGRRGQFYDQTGQLIAFDPSVLENGPGALLVNREAFLEFLEEDDFGLFWTFLGEKEIYKPNHMDRDHWFGRLEINGFNTIDEGKVEGQFGASFHRGGLTKDEPVES